MTNKLGSSNPNRIPMSKPKMYDKIMEGVDLDELLSEGFQKTLSSDEYKSEYESWLERKELHSEYVELIDKIKLKDKSEWCEHQLKVLEESIELLPKLEESLKNQQQRIIGHTFKALIESNQQVDSYGLPLLENKSIQDIMDSFDINGTNPLMDEVLKDFNGDMDNFRQECMDWIEGMVKDPNHPDWKDYSKEEIKQFHEDYKKFKKEDIVEALVYIVSNINLYLPTMVKSVKKHYGNQFQHTLKAIKKFTSDSIISLFKSKKIGKRYMSTSVRKIVKKLEAYWDDNLPLDAVTRKLYFHKLADEYNKSFETIVKIEQRYRPTTFKPSRK